MNTQKGSLPVACGAHLIFVMCICRRCSKALNGQSTVRRFIGYRDRFVIAMYMLASITTECGKQG